MQPQYITGLVLISEKKGLKYGTSIFQPSDDNDVQAHALKTAGAVPCLGSFLRECERACVRESVSESVSVRARMLLPRLSS